VSTVLNTAFTPRALAPGSARSARRCWWPRRSGDSEKPPVSSSVQGQHPRCPSSWYPGPSARRSGFAGSLDQRLLLASEHIGVHQCAQPGWDLCSRSLRVATIRRADATGRCRSAAGQCASHPLQSWASRGFIGAVTSPTQASRFRAAHGFLNVFPSKQRVRPQCLSQASPHSRPSIEVLSTPSTELADSRRKTFRGRSKSAGIYR